MEGSRIGPQKLDLEIQLLYLLDYSDPVGAKDDKGRLGDLGGLVNAAQLGGGLTVVQYSNFSTRLRSLYLYSVYGRAALESKEPATVGRSYFFSI